MGITYDINEYGGNQAAYLAINTYSGYKAGQRLKAAWKNKANKKSNNNSNKGASGAKTPEQVIKNRTEIPPEMEEKILWSRRKNPNKNEVIGGHSPGINNDHTNYAVEVIKTNSDGTKQVKFTTQFEDGNLANIKKSTLFPDKWSNDDIINSIKNVGNSSPLGVRVSDGATLHRGFVNGVQVGFK